MKRIASEESKTIKSNMATWIALSLILVLGVCLRLYGLTKQTIWLDEAMTIRIASHSFGGGLISKLINEVSPPLYYLILHIWIKAFGSGELSTRFLPAIFGILLIPAIYFVGSELFGRKTGLISALITSVSQFHVAYSQEVRMYSMLALLGLFSTYYLFKAVTEDAKKYWIIYALCTVLMLYTHNYGVFILLSGIIFFAIYAHAQKIKWAKFIVTQSVIAMLYAPWLLILIKINFGGHRITGWLPQMRLSHIYETFIIYSGLNFYLFESTINKVLVGIGFILFLSCFWAGIFSLKKNKKIFIPYIQNHPGLILILCYLFVTLAIPMLISIKKPIYLASRYSMAAWPAFALVVGLGVSKIRSRQGLLIIITSILFFSSISLYWHHFVWKKGYEERAIADFIRSKSNNNDLLVFVPSYIEAAIDYYLPKPLKRLGYPNPCKREPVSEIRKEKLARTPYNITELAKTKLRDSSGKIFLVYLESATWVPGIDIVKKSFEDSFMKIESKKYGADFQDIEVIIYKNQ